MAPNTKNRMLWEQVRSESNEDLVRAVKMIADLSEQAAEEHMRDMECVKESITKSKAETSCEIAVLRKILQGNGDPSHSVLARLERIEEKAFKAADTAQRAMWVIVTVVITQVVLLVMKVL